VNLIYAMRRIHTYQNITVAIATLALMHCRQYYNPPANATGKSYLVIYGSVNTGADSTIITLTRTRNLTGSKPVPEPNAHLTVENDAGATIHLKELGNGRYGDNNLNLDQSKNYRLRIMTAEGKTYLSAFVPVKISPPIDSITWQKSDTGVSLFVSSHDPLNKTIYYRWNFVETWEFHTAWESFAHYNPVDSTIFFSGVGVPHICWPTAGSNDILIGSSAKLSSDIIYQQPIGIIPLNSEKLSFKYSVLVNQYALTKEEFSYWDELKRNTETTGSLFDQLPAEITGNVTCVTNPDEPVIGYVGAGSVSSKRIFIDSSEVQPWQFYEDCKALDTPYDKNITAKLILIDHYLPIKEISPGTSGSRIFYAYDYCVDCTARNGATNTKPSFWP